MSSVANPDRPVTVNTRANPPSTMDNRNISSSGSAQSQNSPGTTTLPAPVTAQVAKKGKGKKSTDPVDTNKLVEQHLARLERDAAGDREQEAEIGVYFNIPVPMYLPVTLPSRLKVQQVANYVHQNPT